jgi:hypothetical protein
VNIIPIAITKVMSTEKRFWTGHYSKPKKTTDSTTKPLITTLPGNARKAMEKLLPKGSACGKVKNLGIGMDTPPISSR